MDIALDSNVFISDPWLRSQRMRMLADYIHKFQGRLIIPEVVELEVCANISRQLEEGGAAIAEGLSRAERIGIQGLPDVEPESLVEEAKIRWHKAFEQWLRYANAERVPIDDEAARDAMRRTARREAPCERRPQYRDALIWTSLLGHLRQRRHQANVAFVSRNTKDFAGADDRTLHPQLAQEAGELDILYYSALSEFLTDHAERFDFLTVEWVSERLDFDLLEDLFQVKLEDLDASKFKLIGFDEKRYYYPQRVERVHRVDLEVHDVFIWKFDDAHIEVSISCMAYIEADLVCERTEYPWVPHTSREDAHFEMEFPRFRGFTGHIETGSTVGALVVNNDFEDLWIEEIYSF